MVRCEKCEGKLIGKRKDEELKEWILAQCESCGEEYLEKECWLCKSLAPVENLGGISNLCVTGDEKLFDIYYCDKCRNYFLRVCIDVWLSSGDEEIYNVYVISQRMANECLERISKCPRPNSKHCRCEQHNYFETLETALARFKWEGQKLLVYVGGSGKAHSGITLAEINRASEEFFKEHPEIEEPKKLTRPQNEAAK